eukprot:gene3541-7043_t
MGNSCKTGDRTTNAAATELVRNEVATLLADEFDRLKHSNLSQHEIREKFLHTLRANEENISRKIGAIEKSPEPVLKILHEEHEFRELCMSSVKKIHLKNANTWMCAVDGSKSSEIAFQTVLSMRRRVDHVCLFHSFSTHDDELNDEQRQESVRQKFEPQLLAHLPVNRFSFYWQDRKESLHEAITDLVAEYKTALYTHNLNSPMRILPDFFVLGYSGENKSGLYECTSSPETTTSTSSTTATGTSLQVATTDISSSSSNPQHHHQPQHHYNDHYYATILRSIPFPIIIAKTECPVGARSYILAVDDSEASKRGLDTLLTMLNPRDTLQSASTVHFPHFHQIHSDHNNSNIHDNNNNITTSNVTANNINTTSTTSNNHSNSIHKNSFHIGHHFPHLHLPSHIHHTEHDCKVNHDTSERMVIRQQIKDELTHRAPTNSTYVIIPQYPGKSIPDTLVEYVNTQQPDFFAIAPRAKADLSNMSGHVIAAVQCSILEIVVYDDGALIYSGVAGVFSTSVILIYAMVLVGVVDVVDVLDDVLIGPCVVDNLLWGTSVNQLAWFYGFFNRDSSRSDLGAVKSGSIFSMGCVSGGFMKLFSQNCSSGALAIVLVRLLMFEFEFCIINFESHVLNPCFGEKAGDRLLQKFNYGRPEDVLILVVCCGSDARNRHFAFGNKHVVASFNLPL